MEAAYDFRHPNAARGVAGARRDHGVHLVALLELTKPRITQLVLLTAAAGFYLGARGEVDLLLLLHTLLGTALVAGGTNALNQVWERKIDARMRRTRGRPLPSGRITATQAAVFASAISVLGVTYLALTVNLLTAGLAALTLASYVLLYTPLKRRTSLNTLIGAVPGALPIVGGWTAAGGQLDVAAGALFWILFLWQLPHFLALAWIYREDYRSGGLLMLGVEDPTGRLTGRMALMFAITLLPVSLVPTVVGVTGPLYFFGAAALGLIYAAAGAALSLTTNDRRAWRLFSVSILYLPALLTLMVVDKLGA